MPDSAWLMTGIALYYVLIVAPRPSRFNGIELAYLPTRLMAKSAPSGESG